MGYVYDQNNKNLISDSVVKRVEELKKKIIRKELAVAASRGKS